MNKKIDIIRKARLKTLELLSGLSVEQLNKIPAGFNNNIIWNLGHLIAVQENVFYLRGGLALNVDQVFFNKYKPGSKPEHEIGTKEIETIKDILFSSLDQAEADLHKEIFVDYKGWTTRYGVDINSIDDALSFLPFHEGLHLGCMMAFKRMMS